MTIQHYEKPKAVKIIQIAISQGDIVGLGDDGELYERYDGVWVYLDLPAGLHEDDYEPSSRGTAPPSYKRKGE